jgi:hypothetical protein
MGQTTDKSQPAQVIVRIKTRYAREEYGAVLENRHLYRKRKGAGKGLSERDRANSVRSTCRLWR